jgi:hypothetical protein
MLDKSELKKATILKAALRTYGVSFDCKVDGVGKYVKETVDGLFAVQGKYPTPEVPNEISLYGGIVAKLIPRKNSPLSLIRDGEHYYIINKKDGQHISEVTFTERPIHYEKFTSRGMPMRDVGQVMGRDCLAIAPYRDCDFHSDGQNCRFCNIKFTNMQSGTTKIPDIRDVRELVQESKGRFGFYDLTGGTFNDRNFEADLYSDFGEVIRDVVGQKFSGPFSFTPPEDLTKLERIHKTGVDVISFNREIWNETVWKDVCPGKSKIGAEKFDAAFMHAKNLWGVGNVAVQFIIGPWESNQSLLEGVEYYADMGIMPNITIFGSYPGSMYQNRPSKNLRETIEFFTELGKVYKKHPELFERRCTLTSPSSNRGSISNEVYRGYLTSENFDPEKDLFGIGDWNGQKKC